MPLYLLILVFIFISERTNFIKIISQVLQYFSNHYFLFLFSGFIFSVVILIISAYISYGIYKNLDL
jgi:hypothetical protein